MEYTIYRGSKKLFTKTSLKEAKEYIANIKKS